MMDVIEGKNVSLNIISKSGTTTEPAIAFRILRSYMEKKYGKGRGEARIYATTERPEVRSRVSQMRRIRVFCGS